MSAQAATVRDPLRARLAPGELARAFVVNLVLAEVLHRLRRPVTPREADESGKKHHGLLSSVGRALLSEAVELALEDLRWQGRRAAAAIDRRAARQSVAAHPELVGHR